MFAATAAEEDPGVVSPVQQPGGGRAAAAVAGVVVQLQSLEPRVDAGVTVASRIVGAFTSTGSAGSLKFTLPNPVAFCPPRL